jgi:ornithine cyclodeaminase/alanine dehydrogenase-like protein (mu-crystallin family)
MLILSRDDVTKVLPHSELFEPLKKGFEMLADGGCDMPLRTVIEMGRSDGVSLFMPAYGEALGSAGLKLVTVMNQNPARNLPLIHSAYLYVSAETGEILGLMDAEYLTSARTAVASALATDQLGKSGGSVLGMFGTGVQAFAHVQAFTTLFDIKEVLLFPLTPGLGTEFKGRLDAELDIPISVGDAPDLKRADIICTCTTNTEPLFALDELKPSAHINAMGAYRPTTREIGSDVVAGSVLVVDSYESALAEAGELVIPIREGTITRDHIYASLDELVAGQKEVPDTKDRVTLFKSLGMAMEDLVAADLAYRRAREQGVGTEISL